MLTTHETPLSYLHDLALAHLRESQIEPPTPDRLDRIIRSALTMYQDRFHTRILERLPAEVRTRLDALLTTEVPPEADADSLLPSASQRTLMQVLKADAGPVQVATAQTEVAKLDHVRALKLPTDLFHDVPIPLLRTYTQRVMSEEAYELRRHPEPLRMTLLSAFCFMRQQAITDTLVDLLIQMIHHVGFRAERRVEHALLKDLKRIANKMGLLQSLAETALEHPDESIKEAIFPVVDEQTLHDLVIELQTTNLVKRQRVQRLIRQSYGHHYRRMVPPILRVLVFRSNNTVHRPIIQALEVLTRYATSDAPYYDRDDTIPLDGVVPPRWREMVIEPRQRGPDRIRRIPYEICVLQALREKLRCKEIWVEGSDRYRNPDHDVPSDFADQRESYYAALNLPLESDPFITDLQHELETALQMLNDGLPSNPSVHITEKQGGWIVLTPLTAQPDPPYLNELKAEVARRWEMTSLLDILHEANARIGFTDQFTTLTCREHLDRATLEKRLLLCLYGLGTNTGLKRMAVGNADVTYHDLLYVRRRFITSDHLRAAIAQVVNATIQARLTSIWGVTTKACASDGKKFGAWEQNLRTQWHPRKPGPGIVVYWHVEKKSSCIYSHLQSCTASEVMAMIQGVLRHCTEMTIETQYVDSHGQSEVAFGLCRLLQIDLQPRLKPLHRQRLYLSQSDHAGRYPHLALVLTRAINWDLLRQQYDELVKYASALQSGVADAEAILRRFTRQAGHPTYKAMAELGRVIKTIFLCRYLHRLDMRREIHEALNVIENWNSANRFVFFGRLGEFATNRRDDQEVSMLALHLLQNSLVYVNTFIIQDILAEPAWLTRMTAPDFRALSPLIYHHVNPYGTFHLDLNRRLFFPNEHAA
jgi:TnpA family transposase